MDTSDVIIIAGHELVEPSQRDALVERFTDLVTRARAFDGCIHVAITADSIDSARINTIEIWRGVEALNKWRAQADPPASDEISSMEVKRYNATDGGPLF